MDFVVVLDPAFDVGEGGAGIRNGIDPDVVALEDFGEYFGNAVAFRVLDGCEAGGEVERDRHVVRCGVDRTVVGEPLDGAGRAARAEPSPDALDHEIA